MFTMRLPCTKHMAQAWISGIYLFLYGKHCKWRKSRAVSHWARGDHEAGLAPGVGVVISVVRRKFSSGEVHSVACGNNLYLVCAVCDVTIWRHIHVCKPTFWRSFLTWYAYSSTRTPLILCHSTESKLSALQVRISEENKQISSTLRHSSS